MADDNRSDIGDADFPGTGTGKAGEPDQPSEADARRDARRRVLLGGLATAPLILTLASRPALSAAGNHWGGGKFCGPSTLMSGNTSSNHEPEGCRGKTPGYWKTHADECGDYFFVGPCNPMTSDHWGEDTDYTVPTTFELTEYLEKLKEDPWRNSSKIKEIEDYLSWLEAYPALDSPPFGTPFAAIFGEGCTEDPSTTMMQALWLDDSPPLPPDGAGGPSPVLAHSAAAYCNAYFFGKSTYGLTPEEVVELVVSMINTDPLGLKDILEAMNERG